MSVCVLQYGLDEHVSDQRVSALARAIAKKKIFVNIINQRVQNSSARNEQIEHSQIRGV